VLESEFKLSMEESVKGSPERSLLDAILYYFSILIRYRWFIIVTTLTVAVGAVGFSILSIRLPPDKSPLPNQYTARAVILTQPGVGNALSGAVLSALGVDQSSLTQSTGLDMGAMILQILQSNSLIDQLIREFNIAAKYKITESVRGRSRELVFKKLKFDYNRSAQTIAVSFQDTDPVFARDIVNRLIMLLEGWFNQNSGNAKQSQKQLLEEKIAEVKGGIATLEGKLKDLQTKYGILNAQDLGTSQAATLADLRAQLILKEIEIKNYSLSAIIEDPWLQQLREQRQNILDLIQQAQEGMPELQETTGERKSLPDVAQEFNGLNLELEVQRRIYNTLSNQYEMTKLTDQSGPRFQVLDMAEAPDLKSGPQRGRIIIGATLGAFCASIAFSFFFNVIRKVRSDPEKRKLLKGVS
jgi:tyrosine-protein kinase Etk/Wzc